MSIRTVFLFFLSVLTVFRFYFSAYFDLTPDEAYYWFWSRHPAFSYFDHPPMVAYLIRISTALFGDREWAVRLPALVMGLGDTFLIYLLGRKVFKSEEAGILGALIMNSLLIFSTGLVIITPDAPQLFFWILTVYLTYVALIEKKDHYWALTGVSLGMGLLSKYTTVFFVPSVFLFLLFTPEFRRRLISLKVWSALFIALAVFSPVILWNYQNHWISFLFQFHHGLDRSESFGLKHAAEFLGGQAGIFSPLVFLGFFWAWWKAYQIGRRKGLRQFSFIFWTAAPTFLFFLWNSLRISVGPNWPVFAQTGSVLLLGGFFNQKMRAGSASLWTKGLILFSIALSYAMMMLVHFQAFTKIIPLSVEMDRTHDLSGWSEIRRINERFPETIGWPVIANSHTMVGEVSFYLDKGDVFQMGEPYRITDMSRTDSSPLKGKNFLLITFDDDPFPDKVTGEFERVTRLADIPVFVYRDRERILIRRFLAFRGENFLRLPFPGSVR